MAWYEKACMVEGVSFDRESGLGAVPDGAEIEYMGMTVLMRPSVYLRLCDAIDFPEEAHMRAAQLAKAVSAGARLAPAFLSVELLDRNRQLRQPPVVSRHDGRHRMMAAKILAGDEPMPVQIFPVNMRARHLTDERLAAMRQSLRSQDGTVLEGDVFSEAWLNGRLHLAGAEQVLAP